MAKTKKPEKNSPVVEKNRQAKAAGVRRQEFTAAELRDVRLKLSAVIQDIGAAADAMDKLSIDKVVIDGAEKWKYAREQLIAFVTNAKAAVEREKFR